VDPFAFIWSNLTGPNSQLGSVAKRKLKKHKVTSPFRSFLSSTYFPPLVCQRSLVLYLRGNHLHKAFRIALWRERLLSTTQHTNFKDVQLFRFRYRISRKHSSYFHALYKYKMCNKFWPICQLCLMNFFINLKSTLSWKYFKAVIYNLFIDKWW